MKKYWNEEVNKSNNIKKNKNQDLTNICYNCSWHVNEFGDLGCSHESLYSKNGHIIESKNNRIIKFQEKGNCPFKTISKIFK